jgi:uncharacterized protein
MRTILSALCALALAGAALANTQNPARGVDGIWTGALTVSGGIRLRLVFNVTRGADGALSATLDSIDQNAKGIPVSAVSEKDGVVRFEVAVINGAFDGRFDATRDRIEGTWTQGGSNFPLVLERSAAAPVVSRPQEPKPPFTYAAEDVTFENKGASVTLAGTFTSPKEGGPFATVVLVSGSGPQDRDEALLGHKPFLVLADHLTRRGLAVLRFDDRGTARSTGKYSFDQTAEDYATDTKAAIEYLKSRKDVDPRRIGIVGHSEGGLVAPIVAAADPSVAFVVLMAGPGTPGAQLLAAQTALISKAMGMVDDPEAERKDALRNFELILAEKDNAAALKRLRELRVQELAKLDEAKRKDAEGQQSQWEQGMGFLLTPYIRHFLAYDPRPALTKVKCPVLALTGELDLQVPAGENLLGIATALEAGGNRDFTIVKLPGLNHLFQNAKSGAPSEYGAIEETFSPVALDVIGDWLERRAR